MISAGLLRQRATVQRMGKTADATGFPRSMGVANDCRDRRAVQSATAFERSKVYANGRVINGHRLRASIFHATSVSVTDW